MESSLRECLSQAAWCDVRLSCGGRVFRAHRVVLSSVSPFLRVLLQSRSDEDIPATIVMPDFEVDAMSAVLHYIYNGEVYVPLQHVEDFFTIVKTLQICIDKKTLTHLKEKVNDFDAKILDIEVFRKVMTEKMAPSLKNLDHSDAAITTPRNKSVENNQLDLEHVIKGDRICKSASPYHNDTGYKSNPTIIDRSVPRMKRQKRAVSPAPSVQKRDDGQPKYSPLRDSPSEVYPSSGYSNGPATRVPAITNDPNLQATSSLVTNDAVARSSSLRDASEILRVAHSGGCTASRHEHRVNNEHTLSLDDSATDLKKRLECTKNAIPNIKYMNNYLLHDGYYSSPALRLNPNDLRRESNAFPPRNDITLGEATRKTTVLRPVPTLLPIGAMYNLPNVPSDRSYFRPPPDLLDLSTHLVRLNHIRTNGADAESMALLSTHLNGYAVSRSSQRNHSVSNLYHVGDHSSRYPENGLYGENVLEQAANNRLTVRKATYNKVLASPWCPRGPVCYRPQPDRHHAEPLNSTLVTTEVRINEAESPARSLVVDDCDEDKSYSNDNNNNVREVTIAPTISVNPPSTDESEPDGVSTCTAAGNPHSIEAIIGTDNRSPAMRCATCDKVFTCRTTLEAHVRAHSGTARHTCPECGKSFSQLRNFKYHLSVHRGTREFAATCNVCGKYFNDRGYLSSHMKIHRNRKEYECPHCPKSFNQRVAYNMHVRIHTGVKPHVCAECGKAFSRKMLLKQHQRTHSGERPYACSVCDKRFADRSNMTLHMRLHSGVKPFSCSLCPKSFTKKHHLKTHLNYHTGDKPYSCPRCTLAFSQSSNMRTHLKKCTATGPASPPPGASIVSPGSIPTIS